MNAQKNVYKDIHYSVVLWNNWKIGTYLKWLFFGNRLSNSILLREGMCGVCVGIGVSVWVWVWSLPEIILWLTFPVPTTHAGPAPEGWSWSFSSGSLPTSHGLAAKLGWENMPPTPVLRLFLGGGFLGNLYFFITLLCTFWLFLQKICATFIIRKAL